jgi:hypothetical protein
MYGIVLTLHSLLRWVVLIASIVAAARGIAGWRSRRPWTLADERAGFWFVLALDLQLLLGLTLYAVLSPLTRGAFHDFGGAMRDATATVGARVAVATIVALIIYLLVVTSMGEKRLKAAGFDIDDNTPAD